MIEIADLRFEYSSGGFELAIPSLGIERGEKVAFVGPSGSGKTTLIYLIAGIYRPERGRIEVDGFDVTGSSDRELRNFRISRIGFVFQEFELLDYLTVGENILLPYHVNRSLDLDSRARSRVKDLARTVGLADKVARRPAELSHGERQRVAICRALVTEPGIIVADEPTGNLDSDTTESIMKLLIEQVEKRGTTLIMVTHDRSLLGAFDRVVDVHELSISARGGEGPEGGAQ